MRYPDGFWSNGLAVLPGSVAVESRTRTLAEWNDDEWCSAPSAVGLVRQEAECIESRIPTHRPFTDRLAAVLVRRLRAATGTLDWFEPNELVLMRYAHEGLSISAHRDHARYVAAVLVAGLAGQGVVSVVSDRSGAHVLEQVAVDAGEAYVLRGAGSSTLGECRPMHVVETTRAPRVTLSLRMRDALSPRFAT
jgi:hypothetical protein